MATLLISLLTFLLLATSAHADITTGLIGWWKMDEVSGNLIDSSSQANTGTVTGTSAVTGRRLSGRSFNGTSDKAILPDQAIYQFGTHGNFTICAWAYPTSLTGNRWIIGAQNNGSNGGANFGFVGGFTNVTADNIVAGTSDTRPIALNQWQFVCGAFLDHSSGANNLSYYYNGKLSSTTTFNTAFTAAQGSRCIGATDCTPSTNNGFFSGNLDEVRMYNRQLTAADIAELYGTYFNFITNAVIN